MTQQTNGFKEELDLDQKMMLEQVRENLSDVLKEEHDDRFLLRFLKARSFHEEGTEKMIRRHLRWRKHFSVEYLTKEYRPPSFCADYLNLSVLGFSKDGDLIRILRLGYSDIKGVMLGNPIHEIEVYLAHILTADQCLMEMHRKKTGNSDVKAIYVGDFEGINLYELPWKYGLVLVIRLVRVFEENFPEHLRSAYLINCQTVMYWVLKFLKPFMSEVTASKVHIFGTEGYIAEFLKHAEPEILPEFLGGVRCDTEDDKLCTYLVTKTETIPESGYCCHARRLNISDPDVTEVKVECRNSVSINIDVTESDCAVIWEVDVQDYDLGVGFFYNKVSDSEEVLHCIRPVKRYKATVSPHFGLHICEHPGTYILMLDNRYSYFTDKTALYRVQVKPPLEDKQ